MIDVSYPLRVIYINALKNIRVNNIPIPIFDEDVPLNYKHIPCIDGAICYILVLDQSENEIVGSMCSDKENANITLKIVVKYPLGSGGKRLTEQISNDIQKIIRTNTYTPLISSSDFRIARVTKITSVSITEQSQTHTAYTKNIIYQNKITLKN